MNVISASTYSWNWAAHSTEGTLSQEIQQHPWEVANALAKELFRIRPSLQNVDFALRVVELFKQQNIPQVALERIEGAIYHRLLAPVFLITYVDELSIACKNNQTQQAIALIQEGAPIEVQTLEGRSPLYLSCMNRNEELTVFLLKQGAKIPAELPHWGWFVELICKHRFDGILQKLIERQMDLDHLMRVDNTALNTLQVFFAKGGNIYDVLTHINSDLLFQTVQNFLSVTPSLYCNIPPVELAIIMMSDFFLHLLQSPDLDFLRDEKMIAFAQIAPQVLEEENLLSVLDKLAPHRHREFVQALKVEQHTEMAQFYRDRHPEFENQLEELERVCDRLQALFGGKPETHPWAVSSDSQLLGIFRNRTLPVSFQAEAMHHFRERFPEQAENLKDEFHRFCQKSKEKMTPLWEKCLQAQATTVMLSCWVELEELGRLNMMAEKIRASLEPLTRLKSLLENTQIALAAKRRRAESGNEKTRSEDAVKLYTHFNEKFAALKNQIRQLPGVVWENESPRGLDWDELYQLYFAELPADLDLSELDGYIQAKQLSLEVNSYKDLLKFFQEPKNKKSKN